MRKWIPGRLALLLLLMAGVVPHALAEPKQEPSPTSGRRIKFYRNPMNPAITSKVPMKDEMGMDYIPVYEEQSPKQAPAPSSPPHFQGREAIQLSEGQLRLSGASLIQVERKDLEVRLPVAGRALAPNRVSLQVPERDLPAIKSGLEAILQSPSVGGEGTSFSGKITSMDSLLDPMTRSLRVEVRLEKPVPGLRPESSITGVIRIRRGKTLAVPDSALLFSGEGAYVYVADRARGVLTPTQVKLGLRSANQAEVIEGLMEGDWISSGPNFLIDSESRFRASHD